MKLLQHAGFVELVGMTKHRNQQHRCGAGRHGRHQEQDRQQGVVPQRERLAHAQQGAGVHGNTHAEHHANKLKPLRNRLLHEIENHHDDRHHHEARQEYNAPGHNRKRVMQKQGEAKRVVQASLGVHHKQQQADHNGYGRNKMADLAHVDGLGMTPRKKRRRHKRAAAQTGKEQIPGDGSAPDRFE